MKKNEMLGFAGTLLLVLGVFSPVLTVPAVGTISYFIAGKGDGSLIILSALAVLIFTRMKKFRILWYPAALSLAVAVFTFISLSRGFSGAHSGTGSAVSGYSLSWGWLVLMAGVAFVLASASVREAAPVKEEDGACHSRLTSEP